MSSIEFNPTHDDANNNNNNNSSSCGGSDVDSLPDEQGGGGVGDERKNKNAKRWRKWHQQNKAEYNAKRRAAARIKAAEKKKEREARLVAAKAKAASASVATAATSAIRPFATLPASLLHPLGPAPPPIMFPSTYYPSHVSTAAPVVMPMTFMQQPHAFAHQAPLYPWASGSGLTAVPASLLPQQPRFFEFRKF